jgi:2-deoxy-D-gluconate 3-dehydrogenase
MILNAFSLEGKVAVVTGCDTGLGQGMALGLAEAGCDIVGINIVEPTETIERVTALGRRFLSLTADLRQIDGIPALLERAVAEFGHIDILVNNAGLIRRDDAIDFSEKDWDDVMNLNIKSVFFMSQAAAKHFIAQGNGGKIINIASMLSFQGGIRVPSYTASKSGVMGVTRLMANEWANITSTSTRLHRVTWRRITLNSCVLMSSVAQKSSIVFRRGVGVCRAT